MTLEYANRQLRYWMHVVEKLQASDASDTERREEGERENSPHTPYKEKEGEEKKANNNTRAREDGGSNPAETEYQRTRTSVVPEETRFKKPTIEEIADFCAKRGNGIDATHFWHYYESKGWKVGKSPMKDWTSAVYVWERKDKRDAANQPSNFGKGQVAYLKPTQGDIDKSEGVL